MLQSLAPGASGRADLGRTAHRPGRTAEPPGSPAQMPGRQSEPFRRPAQGEVEAGCEGRTALEDIGKGKDECRISLKTNGKG